ncbi:MAG TPA: lipid-A-disaccharide synthase [Pyrinomonadaceae bacterium]|nr:lipid-A-disaccharide synthase [Pyrinomonadaceae bacterium]
MKQTVKIMLVAGEASGDTHAAKLVRAFRELAPDTKFEFFGATGEKMREAGVETVINSDNLSIVGLPEIARALPMFLQVFQKLKRAAVEKKPDVVILIDFPDFNLKLAKSLKKRGLKIIYYISPQLWAWRKYRVRTIKNYVDLVLTILPFEKDWYSKQGFSKVEYVGSPLAREVKPKISREEFCAKHNLDNSKPIIALLPGSRHKEIVRILPVLLGTAVLMAEKNKELQFVIALASNRKAEEVETAIAEAKQKGLKLPQTLISVQGETHEVLNASDVAAVKSGTTTLETAIIGTPFVIVYKTSAFNWYALRPLISVEHYGLVNLIARERLVKELIQHDFTAENLSAELFRLLEPENNKKMRDDLHEVAETLGHGGASKRAAQAILRLLNS